MLTKQSIEFFSGSGIISDVLKANGFHTLTIDINAKLQPDLCMDILDVTKIHLPPRVDFLWFSPDCTCFSRAGDHSNWSKVTIKYRQYKYTPITPRAVASLRMIDKVAEIISWYPDTKFVIENPIGKIHHTDALRSLGHYRYGVNYADYGFEYSKETYLFTNLMLPLSTKKVASKMPGLRSINSRYQRSMVPPDLIQFLISYL